MIEQVRGIVPPLSREAYDELRDLFSELNLLSSAAKVKSA